MSRPNPLDPERIVRALASHEVRYDRENVERLAAALRELDARVFTESVPEGLPFDCSPRMLGRAAVWNLVTEAGRLDVAFVPAGTQGYEDLIENAVRFEVFGMTVPAASLPDIIRSKEAAGRPQDRQDVVVLREMLRRQGEVAEG